MHHRIKKLLENSGLLPNSSAPEGEFPTCDFCKEIILITGAAGSIGSGLLYALKSASYKKIIAVDNAESPLFLLKQEIANCKSIDFILSDIRDAEAMTSLFRMHKPTIVFHTAAYKHVSLVEDHPYGAIKTNILATKTLADLAVRSGIDRFIFISTDKAVNPVSIMGMTKLIAENYLNNLNSDNSSTRFISARFGNIFGSNGSVVPLFINKLQKDAKITVFNKHASRYFIDKNEACQLILKLAYLELNNYSMVSFNMGNSISIHDLAVELVLAFGKNPKDYIQYSKLLKGERLDEPLISNEEQLVASSDNEIFYIQKKRSPRKKIDLKVLMKITPDMSYKEIRNELKKQCFL